MFRYSKLSYILNVNKHYFKSTLQSYVYAYSSWYDSVRISSTIKKDYVSYAWVV